MTKFIDTRAGRQLLKEHFYSLDAPWYFGEQFIDPNFLEWQDTWADFPLLEDIYHLYARWMHERQTIINGEFRDHVNDYFNEKQKERHYATYLNLEQFLEGVSNRETDLPLELELSIHYDDHEGYRYTTDYLASLDNLARSNDHIIMRRKKGGRED